MRFRRTVLGWSAVLVVALGLSSCGASSSFPSGTGTARITWHDTPVTGTASQAYGGTIAGIPVQGRSTPNLTSNPLAGGKAPTNLEIARWTGSFQGKPFALNLSVPYAALTHSSAALVAFHVRGTWGGQKVEGTANVPNPASSALTFHCTVAGHQVSGTVSPPTHHRGGLSTATARFTVAS